MRNTAKHNNIWSFPPPNFLMMPVAGINISDHSVKMLRFKNNNIEDIEYETVSLVDGIVVYGELQKPREIVRVLSNLRKKYNLQFVRVSIPEEKAYIFNLIVPMLGEREIYDLIQFQLAEHVPLSPDEVVYDFDVVSKDSKNKKFKISVSALPKEIVGQYLSLCKESRLKPLSFEIEPQATSRALIKDGDVATRMIVDIGKTRTGISIMNGHVVRYTSTAEMGGDMLSDAIRSALGVSPEEADTIKQEKGLLKTRDDEKLFDAITASLDTLTEEIRKRVLYWQDLVSKHKKEKTLESVILCGGNASVPGLRDYLEAKLGMQVDVGDVWTNVFGNRDHVPDIDFRNSLAYPTVIGLALSNE